MSIKVKESTLICPASETPRVSLWLSRIDMMIRQPYSHTHVFYIYHHSTNNKNESSLDFFNTNIMKESLSRVLVPFYPVAGRLKFNDENGRYEIECNAKGALFIEAEATTHALADFRDYSSPDNELRKIMFPTIDYSKGLSSFPLLVVQLTRFKCGGVCLATLAHHHVADGTSHLHFKTSWARLAKGLDLSVYPVHDRATYLGPRHPPQVKFQHQEYDHPSSFQKDFTDDMVTSTESVFKLTENQINALKLQATNPAMPSCKVSTFSILAGHVWRSACRARGLASDQDVRFYLPVDGRPRLKADLTLPLPQGYFGNVLFYSICVEKAGEIMFKPLWYVASKIQDSIKKTQDVEYMKSAIDYLESYPDPNLLVRGPDLFSCPNFYVNSWAKLTHKDVEFGWGEPKFTSIRGIKYEGQTYLMASPSGDGSFSIAIKLLSSHMAFFKKHLYDL